MQYPLFTPPTEWVMPESFPNLSEAKEISIDLETKDPNLKSLGSGWPRKDGHVIGIAIAAESDSWYFPIRHENGSNCNVEQTFLWLQETCSVRRDYIMHNALYDMGWLWAEGIKVNGRVIDTMVVSALLDENRFSYALDSVCKDLLGERKDEYELREAAAAFGVDSKSEMWKLPASFVGKYAEQDASLTLKLWNHFKKMIEKEDIQSIFELEISLIPLIFEMRKKGVRVDLEKAEILKSSLQEQEQQALASINAEDVDIWAANSIAKLFDKAGLTYTRTPKSGLPSFTKNFLANHSHIIPKTIVRARELNKARTTFIDTLIKHNHNGRIHAEIHSLRDGRGGTVTGRFSYSQPNLQQVPKRNAEIGEKIRDLFLPEEGEKWGSFDYSSQEPRLVVHYASLLKMQGAEKFSEEYQKDKYTDFHQMAADIVGIQRTQAKNINLGLFYGMGKNKLAEQLGLSLQDAEALFKEYHAKVPFVQELSKFTIRRAANRGVIRTLLGRKCRFDKWEPKMYGTHKPLSHDEAFATHGPAIQRAFTYKALNRLIQGSAADQVKQAMNALFEEKLTPLIQIHDELAVSIPDKHTAEKVKNIMEECVKLNVPSVVDAELGESWGTANSNIEETFK